jgi:uncharacterized protein
MRYLLDVNVLVALALPSHEFHQAAHSWFNREPGRLWATCPLTQGGFLRIASRLMGGSREGVRNAFAALEKDCQNPAHEFWPVETDLRDLSDSQRVRLVGPNEVTDMQLILLAHRQRGQLATFDGGLKQLALGTKYAASVTVI